MRLTIKIALAWLVFAGLGRLDDAINDGLPSAPVARSKGGSHPHSILTMTVLLGCFGYMLAREIRGEEEAARSRDPRKPMRTRGWRATVPLRQAFWASGFVVAMICAWALQIHIFVVAVSLPGWEGRPALLALLGAVLVVYAALTGFWAERYLRNLGQHHPPGGIKPPRAAGVWDPELDHDFPPGSRPAS